MAEARSSASSVATGPSITGIASGWISAPGRVSTTMCSTTFCSSRTLPFQGRERRDPQPVVQVFAQLPGAQRFLWVAVGAGDEPDVHHRIGPLAPHAPHHAV